MKGILKIYPGSSFIYCLDAGHGKNTPGKRSPIWGDGSQLFEWGYVREIRNELIALLDLYKISYYIVNPEDEDISLRERISRVNELHELYSNTFTISIHGNAAGTEKANGYEVFTSPGWTRSDLMADVFYAHAESTKEFRMRRDKSDGDNDKEARFAMLTKTKGIALLTESGFYTNEKECKKMMSRSFVAKVAIMHFTAILEIEGE